MLRAGERAPLTQLGVELHWEAALEVLWAESWLKLRPRPAPDALADPTDLDALDAEVEQRSAALHEAVRRRRFGLGRRRLTGRPAAVGRLAQSSSESSRARKLASRSTASSNAGFWSTKARSRSASHSTLTCSAPLRSASSSMPRSVKYTAAGYVTLPTTSVISRTKNSPDATPTSALDSQPERPSRAIRRELSRISRVPPRNGMNAAPSTP